MMDSNFKPAYDRLLKIGCPVIKGGWDGEDTFRISGESNSDKIWASYESYDYGEYGIAQEVCDILSEYNLVTEWINPGVVGVFLDASDSFY